MCCTDEFVILRNTNRQKVVHKWFVCFYNKLLTKLGLSKSLIFSMLLLYSLVYRSLERFESWFNFGRSDPFGVQPINCENKLTFDFKRQQLSFIQNMSKKITLSNKPETIQKKKLKENRARSQLHFRVVLLAFFLNNRL